MRLLKTEILLVFGLSLSICAAVTETQPTSSPLAKAAGQKTFVRLYTLGNMGAVPARGPSFEVVAQKKRAVCIVKIAAYQSGGGVGYQTGVLISESPPLVLTARHAYNREGYSSCDDALVNQRMSRAASVMFDFEDSTDLSSSNPNWIGVEAIDPDPAKLWIGITTIPQVFGKFDKMAGRVTC